MRDISCVCTWEIAKIVFEGFKDSSIFLNVAANFSINQPIHPLFLWKKVSIIRRVKDERNERIRISCYIYFFSPLVKVSFKPIN